MARSKTTQLAFREADEWTDAVEGTADDLIAAGIIEARHLPPQPGRRKGRAIFMPDGTALAPGAGSCWSLPGRLVIQSKQGGLFRVEKTVPAEEHANRIDRQPARQWGDRFEMAYRGTASQLARAGVPARWYAGLPEPGKSRGMRIVYEGERRIQVNVGERLMFSIGVTHIDEYRHFGVEAYKTECRKWGLEPSAEFLESEARKRVLNKEPTLNEALDSYAKAHTARSEQDFRQKAIDRLREQLQRSSLFPTYPRDISGGYRFDTEAMREFDEVVEELIEVFRYRTVLCPAPERKDAEAPEVITPEAVSTARSVIDGIRLRALDAGRGGRRGRGGKP